MIQKDSPYWYVLIKYWCRNLKKSGLTIPFIVGAQEFVSTHMFDIAILLDEIKNSELEEKIILRYCGDLKEYVLSLDEVHYPVSEHLRGEGGILYFDPEIEELGSFDKVKERLNLLYMEMVIEKKYSKSLEGWGPFSNQDKGMIIQAFS